MMRRSGLAVLLILVFMLVPGVGGTGAVTASLLTSSLVRSHAAVLTTTLLRHGYARLPISFEINEGQVASQVRFLAHDPSSSLFLTSTGMVLSVAGPGARASASAGREARPSLTASMGSTGALREKGTRSTPNGAAIEGRATSVSRPDSATLSRRQATIRLRFRGANPHPRIVGLGRLPGIVNYFIGKDPKQWRTNVRTYARVEYKDLYPGIDLVFYGRAGQLEYDWVVRPHANPGLIRLAVEGTRGPQLDRNGNLVLDTANGKLRQIRPVIYQARKGARDAVSGRYVVAAQGQIGFRLGAYDRGRSLIIDPVLAYSTYLGGSSSDFAGGIALDTAGDAFIAGTTYSTNFPTTSGAFQRTKGNGSSNSNAFVSEINAAGNALLYSTYLGGTGYDSGKGIAVDAAGNAYVAGSTYSTNFPVTSTAYQPSLAGAADAFLAKLNATGSALLYSTYLGSGDNGNSVATDGSGNAYLTGDTTSTNFPVTSSAFQSTFGGRTTDAFVTRIDTTKAGSASLVYSTFLGGANGDLGEGIAVDSSGIVYVTGYTYSQYDVDGVGGFPVTRSAYQSNNNYSGIYPYADAFLSKLDTNLAGSAGLLYSTYFGGTLQDQGAGIAIDGAGNAYVTGFTYSTDLPTTPGAFQTGYKGGGSDAFVAKFNTNAAGAAGLVYSTYLGGTGFDTGAAIAIDVSGNAYVTGSTRSTDFPTQNTNHTTLDLGICGDGCLDDAFVTELNPTGTMLLFSTFLGGSGSDQGSGIAVDASGDIFVTGGTSSSRDFPIDAVQPTFGGGEDAFVTKFAPSPTAARVSRFTARRSGTAVHFRWRMAQQSGVAAFDLYAGHHRLNQRAIPPHQSRSYRYTAHWTGRGPYTLHVILSDGQRLLVGTS